MFRKRHMHEFIPYFFQARLMQARGLLTGGGRIEKGRHCYIDKSVQILGKNCVKFSDNVCIGMNSVLNINGPRNDGIKRLVVGNNSWIGRDTFITTGKIVDIGEFFLGGPHVSIIGANHGFSTPQTPYFTQEVLLDKEIHIGDNCWFGAYVTVIGNVSVGRGSIIGAHSVLTKDIPPFSVAFGNPCRVHRRFDFIQGEWVPENALPHETPVPSAEEYRKLLHEKNPGHINMPVIALTSRFGGC